VDAVGVLLVVDLRDRDELVVQRDREVLVGAVAAAEGERQLLAALGELLGELLPDAGAAAGELELDVRRAALPRAVVEVLLGVLDLRAVEDRVVLEHVPEVLGLGVGIGLLGAPGPAALGNREVL